MSAVQELFAYFCWIMLLSGLPLLLLACSGKRIGERLKLLLALSVLLFNTALVVGFFHAIRSHYADVTCRANLNRIAKAAESSPDQEVLRLLERFRNQPQGQLSADVPAVTETPDTSAGTPAGKLPQADETSGRNRRDR